MVQPKVMGIVLQGGVVGSHIDADRKDPVGVEAGGCNVDIKLACTRNHRVRTGQVSLPGPRFVTAYRLAA